MKKIFLGLVGLICLMTATGCSDNSGTNNNYNERTFTGAFTYINDLATATDAVIPASADCKMRMYFGDNTAEVMLAGLKTVNDETIPTLTLTGLSWYIDRNGWYVLEVPTGGKLNVKASNYGTVPEISDFKLRFCQRQAAQVGAGGSDMGFVVYFVADNIYRYTLSYPAQTLYGTTVSTLTATGSEFSTTITTYNLVFNLYTRQLNIDMTGAKFIQFMQPQDIAFKNIPFTIRGTKAYWNMEALTPFSGNTPMTSFPITNLTGEYDFGQGLKMNYDCTPGVIGDGTTVFHVTVDCAFANSSPNDVQ